MASLTQEDQAKVETLVEQYNTASNHLAELDEEARNEEIVKMEDAAIEIAVLLLGYVPDEIVQQVREQLEPPPADWNPDVFDLYNMSSYDVVVPIVEKVLAKMLPQTATEN